MIPSLGHSWPERIRPPQLIVLMLFLYCFPNVCCKYKTPFTRLDVNIAQYFWQWNARTDHVTISHELLSMDNFASFHPIQSYISEMCKKVSRKVGVLMRLRNMIPESAKLTMYKSSILPYLTYCQLVWHFCKSSDSKKVERIQERALRAVYRTKSESYDNLLKRAQIPTLENRRLLDIAILM
jgi:hypothetical protein